MTDKSNGFNGWLDKTFDWTDPDLKKYMRRAWNAALKYQKESTSPPASKKEFAPEEWRDEMRAKAKCVDLSSVPGNKSWFRYLSPEDAIAIAEKILAPHVKSPLPISPPPTVSQGI